MAKVLHLRLLLFSPGMSGAICGEHSVVCSHHSIVLQLIVTIWWHVTAGLNDVAKKPVLHNVFIASIA